MIIFMIFTLLYYLNKVKGYLQLLLCEAPKRGTVEMTSDVTIQFFTTAQLSQSQVMLVMSQPIMFS